MPMERTPSPSPPTEVILPLHHQLENSLSSLRPLRIWPTSSPWERQGRGFTPFLKDYPWPLWLTSHPSCQKKVKSSQQTPPQPYQSPTQARTRRRNTPITQNIQVATGSSTVLGKLTITQSLSVTGTQERMGWHPLDRGKFMNRLCPIVCTAPCHV
jgi:hypothetical protein